MSALPSLPEVVQPFEWRRMQAVDVDEVAAIEMAAYRYPWTPSNFLDSLYSAYQCWTLRDADNRLLGYFLSMHAVDEAHLLNITVDPQLHGRGLGRTLMDQAMREARLHGMESLLLEVRPSNLHAIAIYQHFGFTKIGIRKNYYPADDRKREDAIVMRKML